MNNSTTTYKRLGDYIREVDVRNRDLQCTNLLGLSIAKTFIPSIANTVGTDFRPYKIVKHNQFAYVPVTSRNGDKITVALHEGQSDCIISQAYTSFEIKEVKELLPEYLMMWFRRPEFDRYARFKSHGSAREVFDWEEMCNVMLPIPSLEEQQRIVDRYNAIQHRIETNKQTIAKLEEAAQALYRKMFVDNIDPNNLPESWRIGTLGEVGEIITGKTPSSNSPEDFGLDVQFVTPGDFKGNRFVCTTERYLSKGGATKLKNKIIRKNDIVVTCIGSDMGKVAIAIDDCISNQQINAIRIYLPEYRDYLYVTLLGMKAQLLDFGTGSSTLPMLNKGDFESIEIIVPSNDRLRSYDKKMNSISHSIYLKQKENEQLIELLSLLMVEMGVGKRR